MKFSASPNDNIPASLVKIRMEAMANAILIADDSAPDIALLGRLFEQIRLSNPTFVVTDGEQTINYLAGSKEFSDRNRFPFPILLLLDLRMPKKDGFEVLRWIRANSINCAVVVLTSLQEVKVVREAYALGALSFLIKPVGEEEFRNMMIGVPGMSIASDGGRLELRYEPVPKPKQFTADIMVFPPAEVARESPKSKLS